MPIIHGNQAGSVMRSVKYRQQKKIIQPCELFGKLNSPLTAPDQTCSTKQLSSGPMTSLLLPVPGQPGSSLLPVGRSAYQADKGPLPPGLLPCSSLGGHGEALGGLLWTEDRGWDSGLIFPPPALTRTGDRLEAKAGQVACLPVGHVSPP